VRDVVKPTANGVRNPDDSSEPMWANIGITDTLTVWPCLAERLLMAEMFY